jgi:hypothetical protein
MPGNVFTTQIIKDTTERAVIKLTGKFDGSGQEDNPNKISANSLYGALNTDGTLLSEGGTPLDYYGLSIHRLWYDTVNATTSDVELYWNANPTIGALMLSGTYEYDGNSNWVTLPNAAYGADGVSDCNGDIGIRTRGMVANTSYTIIIELRKDNAYYQRGQFNDPAAFNYGNYGLSPNP